MGCSDDAMLGIVVGIAVSDAALPECDKTGLELVAPAVAACKAAE